MAGELSGIGVVVAGASQGLGLEVARTCAREGASLVLCARDPAQLEAARAEVAALALPGRNVVARPCDVSSPAEVEGLLSLAEQACPDL